MWTVCGYKNRHIEKYSYKIGGGVVPSFFDLHHKKRIFALEVSSGKGATV